MFEYPFYQVSAISWITILNFKPAFPSHIGWILCMCKKISLLNKLQFWQGICFPAHIRSALILSAAIEKNPFILVSISNSLFWFVDIWWMPYHRLLSKSHLKCQFLSIKYCKAIIFYRERILIKYCDFKCTELLAKSN